MIWSPTWMRPSWSTALSFVTLFTKMPEDSEEEKKKAVSSRSGSSDPGPPSPPVRTSTGVFVSHVSGDGDSQPLGVLAQAHVEGVRLLFLVALKMKMIQQVNWTRRRDNQKKKEKSPGAPPAVR